MAWGIRHLVFVGGWLDLASTIALMAGEEGKSYSLVLWEKMGMVQVKLQVKHEAPVNWSPLGDITATCMQDQRSQVPQEHASSASFSEAI